MGRRPLPKRITPLVVRPLTLTATWGISSPFGLLSPTSGQVTNALLTRSPLEISYCYNILVRLACIRHAASVHPEPGSNSPQKSTSCDVQRYISMRLVKENASYLLLLITIQMLRSGAYTGAGFYPHTSGLSRLQTRKVPMPIGNRGLAARLFSVVRGMLYCYRYSGYQCWNIICRISQIASDSEIFKITCSAGQPRLATRYSDQHTPSRRPWAGRAPAGLPAHPAGQSVAAGTWQWRHPPYSDW